MNWLLQRNNCEKLHRQLDVKIPASVGVLASGIDWTWQVIGWDSKSYLEVCSCLDGVQKAEMLHIWEASLMASCIGAWSVDCRDGVNCYGASASTSKSLDTTHERSVPLWTALWNWTTKFRFFVFFGWGSNRMSLSYVGHCLFFWWGGVTAYVGQCLFSPWILRGTGNTPGFPVGTQHWQGSQGSGHQWGDQVVTGSKLKTHPRMHQATEGKMPGHVQSAKCHWATSRWPKWLSYFECAQRKLDCGQSQGKWQARGRPVPPQHQWVNLEVKLCILHADAEAGWDSRRLDCGFGDPACTRQASACDRTRWHCWVSGFPDRGRTAWPGHSASGSSLMSSQQGRHRLTDVQCHQQEKMIIWKTNHWLLKSWIGIILVFASVVIQCVATPQSPAEWDGKQAHTPANAKHQFWQEAFCATDSAWRSYNDCTRRNGPVATSSEHTCHTFITVPKPDTCCRKLVELGPTMYFGFLLLVFTNMVTDTYQDRVRFCDMLKPKKGPLLLKLHRATVDLIRSISQGSHALFTIRDLQFYTDACGALPQVTLKIETSSLSSKLRWEEALAAAGQAPLVHPELRRCQTWSRQQQTI